MAQINRATPSSSGLNDLLTIGGGAAGAYYGGPMGAAAGMGAGQAAGGILNAPPPQAPSVPQGDSAAMARRQMQESQDNLAILKQAEASLPSLPENLRQQYAPAIIEARMKAEQDRKNGVR